MINLNLNLAIWLSIVEISKCAVLAKQQGIHLQEVRLVNQRAPIIHLKVWFTSCATTLYTYHGY